MRAITKGQEPYSLVQHRANAHSDYENYADKEGLREALVRDQRGLCCYCMSQVAATSTETKIEHWRCQSRHANLALVYSNLLAACPGGTGLPIDDQYCDTRKGERDLKFNPANRDHNIEQRIRFGIDGTVTSTDAEFDTQLNNVLNLNCDLLKNRRRGIVEGLVEWLRDYRKRNHRGPDNATLMRKRALLMPAIGDLKPYAPVAVWWLDQRAAR